MHVAEAGHCWNMLIDMKTQAFVLFLLALVLTGCAVLPEQGKESHRPVLPGNDLVACTQEAKICPDGTAVVRVPPDCEFAPCPKVETLPVEQEVEKPLPQIVVSAVPQSGFVPMVVKLTANVNAELKGCPEWNFGDGTSEKPACVIQPSYEVVHKYSRPGNYGVVFSLGSGSGSVVVNVQPPPGPAECDEDSDCVPAQCCHAADCIIKEKMVDCSRVKCTAECRPGTLDCGGRCVCVNNRCTGSNFYPGIDAFTGVRPWQAFP